MRTATKRGDNRLMKARLLDANDEPVDLADSVVEFFMKSGETGELKVNGAAGTGTEDGFVSYRLTTTDTDTIGEFLCWFRVGFPDSTTESFPTGADDDTDYWTLHVVEPVA